MTRPPIFAAHDMTPSFSPAGIRAEPLCRMNAVDVTLTFRPLGIGTGRLFCASARLEPWAV